MTSEKSQLKFARSEETGELIGFVSRHSKTRKLMGVREDSRFGKQICVLSEVSANERITEILDFAILVNGSLCQQAAAPSKEGAFLIFGEENGRNIRFYHR